MTQRDISAASPPAGLVRLSVPHDGDRGHSTTKRWVFWTLHSQSFYMLTLVLATPGRPLSWQKNHKLYLFV